MDGLWAPSLRVLLHTGWRWRDLEICLFINFPSCACSKTSREFVSCAKKKKHADQEVLASYLRQDPSVHLYPPLIQLVVWLVTQSLCGEVTWEWMLLIHRHWIAQASFHKFTMLPLETGCWREWAFFKKKYLHRVLLYPWELLPMMCVSGVWP